MEVRKTTWICELPSHTHHKIQQEIMKRLSDISEDRVMEGMSGKVCDLEEIIHVEEIRDWL